MVVDIVNPLDIPDWDEQVLRLPNYSFFHSATWARVLSESYGYKPLYFMYSDDSGMTGMVPVMDVKSIFTGHRGVSLPFTDFCEPIKTGDLRFQDVLSHMTTYGKDRRWKYIDLRGGQGLLPDAQPSTVFWGHTLSLSHDENKVFATLKDSTRRNVMKAVKEGVEVKTVRSLEALKDFYKLNCIARKKHGLPPQPYYFFRNVYEQVIAKDLGFISLAYFQNKPIAGNMYFHFGKKAIYKYGASDQRYQRLRASNLVMWEAIKWYCNNGHESLSFGRTALQNEGLRQFKNGWAAQENTIKYYRYDIPRKTFLTSQATSSNCYARLFRKIPIWLLRLLGAVTYRHIG